MEEDFIYWRHPSVPGIKVEEVSGGDRYSGNLWKEMARQVYCENGRDAYREIGHYKSGAPFLYGESSRISVSDSHGLLVVATLPPTPEVDLALFSERAALGVDVERADREQVIRLRSRFLSGSEMAEIDSADVERNVLAWTAKEAAYKAALTAGLDFRSRIIIERLPLLGPPTPVFDAAEFNLPPDTKKLPEEFFGEVRVLPGTDAREGSAEDDSLDSAGLKFTLYSYRSDDFIVTLCYSPRSAKFGKAGL